MNQLARWPVAVAAATASTLVLVLALIALMLSPAPAGGHEGHGHAEFGAGAGLGVLDVGHAINAATSPPLALGSSGSAGIDQGSGLGPASANDGFHSANFRMIGHQPIKITGGGRAQGSDLAFQGGLIVAGTYEGTALFKRTAAAPGLRQISFHDCPGSQGDVTILGDHVFVSIDSPSSNNVEAPGCNDTASTDSPSSLNKEGLRILDVSDRRNPRQVGFVETECGSHTQTLIPGAATSYIYVQSYPLTQTDNCTEANHPEGEISIVEVPNDHPEDAQVASIPDILPPTVSPDSVGCHDIGVLPAKDLAAAACLGAFAILDTSDPANPKTLSTVQNAAIELDHSAQLTWDGRYAVIGDEHAGAAGGGGCSTNQSSPIGAMWYYDITDRTNPTLEGSYSLPRVPPVDSPDEAERFRCTTHNYMVLPMRDASRYVAVSPYYAGGLSVVDFTDPGAPVEQGYHLPQLAGSNPDMWSGYYNDGRIYTNEHASKHGLGVFEVDGFGNRQVRDLGSQVNPQTQVR